MLLFSRVYRYIENFSQHTEPLKLTNFIFISSHCTHCLICSYGVLTGIKFHTKKSFVMFIIETQTLNRCWQMRQQFENTIKLRKNKRKHVHSKVDGSGFEQTEEGLIAK